MSICTNHGLVSLRVDPETVGTDKAKSAELGYGEHAGGGEAQGEGAGGGAKDCVTTFIGHYHSNAQEADGVAQAKPSGLKGMVKHKLGVTVSDDKALGEGVKDLLDRERGADGLVDLAEGDEEEEDEEEEDEQEAEEEAEEAGLRRQETEAAATNALFSVPARRMSADVKDAAL